MAARHSVGGYSVEHTWFHRIFAEAQEVHISPPNDSEMKWIVGTLAYERALRLPAAAIAAYAVGSQGNVRCAEGKLLAGESV